MSALAECAPSRWADFLSISDNSAPTSTDSDFFVGKNTIHTLTIQNGGKKQVRDVVVLGDLTIKPSQPANLALKTELVARDIFIIGLLSLDVDITCNKYIEYKNAEAFRSELHELFLGWMDMQKESVERIGLRSILT